MFTRSTLFLVVAVAVLATIVSANQKLPKNLFDSPYSKKLNRKEFLESITDGNVHVVEFYSDGCRGCQKFAGDWKAIAEKFKDTEGVQIAQVNCSIEGRLCRQRAVNGYPTVKVFQNGEEYITYEGIMFGELVEKFIASVARDLLQETTK
ncbi:hypothetical protein BSKO_04171 [Bryopsis sp. KO-2023]|nr:hypothetical protein BSKO_04171 [Bryopsis sp. KO-2023]